LFLLTRILCDTTGQLYIIGSNCISSILLLVVNLQPIAKIPVLSFLLVRKWNKLFFVEKREIERGVGSP
jgi:hypothetical protein